MSGSHIEHDVHTGHDTPHAAPVGATEANGQTGSDADQAGDSDTVMATIATVGVVGVAAVVFEAALIPGLVLGVAAALAPSYMPRLGSALNPLFRSSVRGAYKFGQKTREMMSEAREHMSDIAAEIEAEGEATVVNMTPKSKPDNVAA